MKTAAEWVESDSGHFDIECDECKRVIEAIQADALEEAAIIVLSGPFLGDRYHDAAAIRAIKPVKP